MLVAILVAINLILAGIVFKKYYGTNGFFKSASSVLRTAAHEAGHTIVALKSPAVVSVKEVTILDTAAMHSSGTAGLTTILFNSRSLLYYWERVIVLMGGAAGEMHYCGTMLSRGCKKDLLEALDLARQINQTSQVAAINREFPFDVAKCYAVRPTQSECFILNTAYSEARKRIHNNSDSFKLLTTDLLKSGKLLEHELPRI